MLVVKNDNSINLHWLVSKGESDFMNDTSAIADAVRQIRVYQQFPNHYVTTYREFLEDIEDAMFRLNLEQEMEGLMDGGRRGPAGITAVMKAFEIPDSSLKAYLALKG